MTPAQAEVYDLYQQGLNQTKIAERLGKSRRTVRELLARAKRHAEIDPAILGAMQEFGTGLEPDTLWIKNKQYSLQLRKQQTTEEDLLTRAVEAFSEIPAAPTVAAPLEVLEDQMVVYPLFDVHHGLRAHATISGEEIDLDISKNRILTGLSRLMGTTPAAQKAILINGGDFTHQTDDNNRTRRSGHVLDVAGRNIITVDQGLEIISGAIEMALTKHQVVEYYSVPGNHDPQNWEMILLGLRERYRNNPRIRIYCNWVDDKHSSEFAVVEHGKVAIFIHHGDKRTPKDLAMFCAAEFSEVWGRTEYRIVMTGHLHHIKVDEFPGIYWMQMPAISARDAHAAGGYSSHSLLLAIAFDHESEVGRHSLRLK